MNANIQTVVITNSTFWFPSTTLSVESILLDEVTQQEFRRVLAGKYSWEANDQEIAALSRRYGVPGRKGYVSIKKFREALKAGSKKTTTKHKTKAEDSNLSYNGKNELPASLRSVRWGKEKLSLKIRQKILERTKGDQYQQMFFMFRYVV